MLEWLEDPVLGSRLGENARQAAPGRFHIERFASDWDEAFRSVTGKTLTGRSIAAPGVD